MVTWCRSSNGLVQIERVALSTGTVNTTTNMDATPGAFLSLKVEPDVAISWRILTMSTMLAKRHASARFP
ncbi:hypothetical protein M413DRAFT_32607 [Hebeloma cylindrosporum]|uniref:Uncharacterized protein n=1 Tax=Hebeloma cylindrosporum TaxID=76867 RepID=A0A0C2Y2I3_HEBCY|nr:hypothetical protein M413DRAFT_32607 [Hebeloma cylindrosporum h7]